MQKAMEIQTENLVIGSGLSGLFLALKLAEAGQEVLIVSKAGLSDSNSFLAQGGIASVSNREDSFAEHVEDTLRAGAGLCHESIVRLVVEAGPKVISDLVNLGVDFTKDQNSVEDHLHLTREGGHSKRRVVHSKDLTGRAIMETLIQKTMNCPNIKVLTEHTAVDLITSDKYQPNFAANRCLGAYVLKIQTKEIFTIKSSRTFLCTGGHGRLYLYTTNPSTATGDGLALGWRAGSKVANLEFMQFHPTCLFHPSARGFLISEALRGEGAILRNASGHDFVKDYHSAGSLAARDIIARAIDWELKKTGEEKVFLDATHLGEKVKELFPTIYQTCLQLGIDISCDKIPVVPAAHYSCGGLVTDSWGQTNISNLFAIGEVACTGLHGANRLASNSLLEACVMASRAAEKLGQEKPESLAIELPPWNKGRAIPTDEGVILTHLWDEIRRMMWHYVGIVRSDKRLKRAFTRITAIQQELDQYYWDYEVDANLLEVRNLAQVALLTIRCAMNRKESRGIHYTLDYPTSLSPARDTIIW